MTRHRLLPVTVTASVLIAAGCTAPVPNQPGIASTSAVPGMTAGPSASANLSPSAAGSTSSAPCPAPAPASITVAAGVIPDGTSFGFVHHFDGTSLYVDPAELFADDAAVTAAREDGEIGSNEDLPDPFYIRNRSSAIVRVPVAAGLHVSLLDNRSEHGPSPRDRTSAEFAGLYCAGTRPDWVYSAGPEMPADLTVKSGEVTRIVEQYLP